MIEGIGFSMLATLSFLLASGPVAVHGSRPTISYKYSGTKHITSAGKESTSEIKGINDLYINAVGPGSLKAKLNLEAEVTIDWKDTPRHLRPEFFILTLLSSWDQKNCEEVESFWQNSHGKSGSSNDGAAPLEYLVKVPITGAKHTLRLKVQNSVQGLVDGPNIGSVFAAIELRLDPLPKTVFDRSLGREFVSYFDDYHGKNVEGNLLPDNSLIDETKPNWYCRGYRLNPDRSAEATAPIIRFNSKRDFQTDIQALETLGVAALGKDWRFKDAKFFNAKLKVEYLGKKFWFYPSVQLGEARLSVTGIPDVNPTMKYPSRDKQWSTIGKPGETLPRLKAEFRETVPAVEDSPSSESRWIQWYGGEVLYHHYAVLQIRSRTGQIVEILPIVWREHIFTSSYEPPTYAVLRMGLGYDGGPLPYGN